MVALLRLVVRQLVRELNPSHARLLPPVVGEAENV